MSTVNDKRKALEAERAKRMARFAVEAEILDMLPQNIPSPTISNESETAFFGKLGVWLSFHRDYEATWTAPDVLAELEQAGFTPMPATLCKWDDYRRHPEPGAQDMLPEINGRYKLTDSTPIAPLWFSPNQHTKCEAKVYYLSPVVNGRQFICKVTIETAAPVWLAARRVEVKGDWYYERGSARLQYPEAWHAIRTPDGTSVAGISNYTSAQVDTAQGISGDVYFEIYTEQDNFPLTPSELLRVLETKDNQS